MIILRYYSTILNNCNKSYSSSASILHLSSEIKYVSSLLCSSALPKHNQILRFHTSSFTKNINKIPSQRPIGVQLSNEQLKICELVMQGHNIFYTGSAGTGKSVLLRHIIKELKQKYPSNYLAVTASTGIAAYNIGGITLHSFAGVGIAAVDVKKLISKIKKSERKVKNWKDVKVLIVDEISMIHGNLLDKLNVIARHFKENDLPFGGIQLIFCGDFYQLPPVINKEKDKTSNNSYYPRLHKTHYRQRQLQQQNQTELSVVSSDFAFESKSWNEAIHYKLMLTKVFRQGKDIKFINMLNELRHGKPSDDTIQNFHLLNEPISSLDGIEPAELYPTRSEVSASNMAKLRQLPHKEYKYKAVDMLNGHNPYVLKDFLAPERLVLKKDCQVMMIKNLDETLVNGTLGKIIDFVDPNSYCFLKEYDEINGTNKNDANRKKIAIDDLVFDSIKLKNPESADPILLESIIRKQEYRTHYEKSMSFQQYPLVRFLLGDGSTRDVLVCPETWTIEDENEMVVASRTQIPLTLAWAISIHKSQGQTLTKLKVDLRKVFEKGQTYVALSRVSRRENLQVLNFTSSRVMTDHKVIDFYKDIVTVDSISLLNQQQSEENARVKKETMEKNKNIIHTNDAKDEKEIEGSVQINGSTTMPGHRSAKQLLQKIDKITADSNSDAKIDKTQKKSANTKNKDADFNDSNPSVATPLLESSTERPYL